MDHLLHSRIPELAVIQDHTLSPAADVDELEGGYGHLQPGTTARLPLLMLEGRMN